MRTRVTGFNRRVLLGVVLTSLLGWLTLPTAAQAVDNTSESQVAVAAFRSTAYVLGVSPGGDLTFATSLPPAPGRPCQGRP